MKQIIKEWRKYITEEDNLEQNIYSFDFTHKLKAKNHTQVRNFLPIDLFWTASMVLKMTALKID